jgi:hypothetical protein
MRLCLGGSRRAFIFSLAAGAKLPCSARTYAPSNGASSRRTIGAWSRRAMGRCTRYLRARDVNGEKVYLRSRVVPATIVSAGGANVSEAIGMLMDGALDLHPQELTLVFNPDVVALGVPPGPGNVQPMFGGASHKLQFCPLAAFFVVLYISSFIGH